MEAAANSGDKRRVEKCNSQRTVKQHWGWWQDSALLALYPCQVPEWARGRGSSILTSLFRKAWGRTFIVESVSHFSFLLCYNCFDLLLARLCFLWNLPLSWTYNISVFPSWSPTFDDKGGCGPALLRSRYLKAREVVDYRGLMFRFQFQMAWKVEGIYIEHCKTAYYAHL